MSQSTSPSSEILYSLDDRPDLPQSLAAAFQHVLASFVGIITPTLVICTTLGLEAELSYMMSMALLVSGLATFIQVKTFGPVGSGLVAVQGTSFAFLGALLLAGFSVRERGGTDQQVIAMLMGVCFWGAFVEIILSQFIQKMKRIVTPLVTGIVITTIGISLIKVGMTDLAGGYGAEDFGEADNVALGLGVLVLIILLTASSSPWIRLSAIIVGMIVGTLVALFAGMSTLEIPEGLPLLAVPVPLKYGMDFDWAVFVPVAIIYLLTAIETSGDLTANSLFCGLPVRGNEYLQRIRGGVLADGINSLMAALLNTFPNTTFGQNNAVIQMTGVASRYVGFYVAGLLVLLGLFPMVGALLQVIPKPVLGGATLVMFGTIAAGGIRILASESLDRRKTLIIATSLGVGLGVMMVPDALQTLPGLAKNILGSSVSAAGTVAIVLSLFLPAMDSSVEPEGQTLEKAS